MPNPPTQSVRPSICFLEDISASRTHDPSLLLDITDQRIAIWCPHPLRDGEILILRSSNH